METIQVVLDSRLLRATDGAARKAHVNRSALIRRALDEYLRRLEVREMEEKERQAYRRHPDNPDEIALWAREAVWPAD